MCTLFKSEFRNALQHNQNLINSLWSVENILSNVTDHRFRVFADNWLLGNLNGHPSTSLCSPLNTHLIHHCSYILWLIFLNNISSSCCHTNVAIDFQLCLTEVTKIISACVYFKYFCCVLKDRQMQCCYENYNFHLLIFKQNSSLPKLSSQPYNLIPLR